MLLKRLTAVIIKTGRIKDVMFSRYLLLTNVGISVTLSGVGDILVQGYQIKNSGKSWSWDSTRTNKMAAAGLTVGLLCHNWYKILDNKFPGRQIKTVLAKVLVDQIIFSPICLAVFFITLAVVEKSSWKQMCVDVKRKGSLLYTADWIVWPPAQLINFYLLPTKYRVLYDNAISLGFDIYTSHVKNDLDS